MVMDINIKSANDVERLWVHSNDGMIMVDARSLLGLFALIGKPCKLVAEDSTDYKVLAKVAKKAGVA